jgi:large subunit ribosomal protein L24
MSKWIKKGDNVYVINGNDKGKTGIVMSRMKDRVTVKGVNVRKKNMKKTKEKKTQQFVYIEMPIHVSNVALCDKEGKKIKNLKVKKEGSEKNLVYFEKGKELVHRKLIKKS